jgi:hypothetical protein
MSKLIDNILGTFTNVPGSGSARKWTAFNFVAQIDLIHLVTICYVIWGKDIEKVKLAFSLMETLFFVDCAMVLLMLSIVTFQQISEFKNGKKEETPQ